MKPLAEDKKLSYTVELVTEQSKGELVSFLKTHSDHTLFLLGNLSEHGYKLTDALNSGNFKLIRDSEQIVAAFCLCRRGTLLIHATMEKSLFPLVVKSCLDEGIPLKGVIGEWSLCKSLWEYLKEQQLIKTETFISKEVLYRVNLQEHTYPPQSSVRLLGPSDYSQWSTLRDAYVKEKRLPDSSNEAQKREAFASFVNRKVIWGLFLDKKLLSIANLNAHASDLAQLGGVFTDSEYRRKGYSRAVLQQLFNDCKSLHGITKLIIFTGEDNPSARKLYESFGIDQVGHYALLFGF